VHSVLFDANLRARVAKIISTKDFVHLESLVNETYSPHRLSDPNITKPKLWAYRMVDRITQIFGVDHFRANGESVAAHYVKQLRIDPKRITVVPRGRARNDFLGDVSGQLRLRAELGTGDRVLIVHVARQEFQKGHDVLIDAIARPGTVKGELQFVLVGRPGSMSEVIARRIREYGLDDCVVQLGHRDDVPLILAAADILVFPSRFEGLSGVLIEAEAAGLPIVCSDIPNNREVADDLRNAVFVNVDDIDGLAQAITRLSRDKELRKQMGAASLAVYEERFTIEKIHKRMLTLLKSLV
jgi:glycosyltransferase involved in cell wall biosynthesis